MALCSTFWLRSSQQRLNLMQARQAKTFRLYLRLAALPPSGPPTWTAGLSIMRCLLPASLWPCKKQMLTPSGWVTILHYYARCAGQSRKALQRSRPNASKGCQKILHCCIVRCFVLLPFATGEALCARPKGSCILLHTCGMRLTKRKHSQAGFFNMLYMTVNIQTTYAAYLAVPINMYDLPKPKGPL